MKAAKAADFAAEGCSRLVIEDAGVQWSTFDSCLADSRSLSDIHDCRMMNSRGVSGLLA